MPTREQCIATRPGKIDTSLVIRCKKWATHGQFCRMHAQSLGGWVLVKPEVGYKYGEFHRRTVELLALLRDAVAIQRQPCNHVRGIGKPGCLICDPRISETLGFGDRASKGDSDAAPGLLAEDHSEIAVVPDEQRDVWLTAEQKRQPGIPDFSRVRKGDSDGG